MKKLFEKLNKLLLPAVILIVSIILGGFYYMSQIAKQNSIERQQQVNIEAERQKAEIKAKQDQINIEAERQNAEIKAKQDQIDYVAKRKMDCFDIYKAESKKWNNVEDWTYHDPADSKFLLFSDTCEIIYKNWNTGENFSKFY